MHSFLKTYYRHNHPLHHHFTETESIPATPTCLCMSSWRKPVRQGEQKGVTGEGGAQPTVSRTFIKVVRCGSGRTRNIKQGKHWNRILITTEWPPTRLHRYFDWELRCCGKPMNSHFTQQWALSLSGDARAEILAWSLILMKWHFLSQKSGFRGPNSNICVLFAIVTIKPCRSVVSRIYLLKSRPKHLLLHVSTFHC